MKNAQQIAPYLQAFLWQTLYRNKSLLGIDPGPDMGSLSPNGWRAIYRNGTAYYVFELLMKSEPEQDEKILQQHNQNRAGDMASVAQSLKRLRDVINANLENSERALWVTLTYAENMTDTKRLYKDFHAFWKRFLRYLKRGGHPGAEYIAAAEPQGRGAWHLHCLFLFPDKAPFIPNADIARVAVHFAVWLEKRASTPEGMVEDLQMFASLKLGDD